VELAKRKLQLGLGQQQQLADALLQYHDRSAQNHSCRASSHCCRFYRVVGLH
jgi:hypothetical protein